ncbi:MAG: hypothetical protein V4692_12000, partial [Bdellovibrionota bacterium]
MVSSSRLAVLPILFAVLMTAFDALAARQFGPHLGYLESTKGERELKVEELVLFNPPPPLGPPLTDRIFNE